MSVIEDKFRAALAGIAAEITDDSAPPLRLPSRRPSPHRSHRWLAPIAAAGSVAVVAAGVLVVSQLAGHRTMPRSDLGAVPPYYVALRVLSPACCSPGKPFAPRTDAVVRATATGAAIATVAVPRPYFTFVAVSGEADDRTFVLAAQRFARFPVDGPATRFYLLRINPAAATASERATLTALPIPVEPKGVDLNGLAVSPDGSKLAVTSTSWITLGQVVIPRLHVFDMATGAERSWQGWVVSNHGLLSWAADNTTLQLVGRKFPSGGPFKLLLLDVAKPGSNLVANSRTVTTHGPTAGSRHSTAISGDGRTVALVRAVFGPVIYERLDKVDVRTGKVTVLAVRNVNNDIFEEVLWVNQTGTTLIVTGTGHHNRGAGIYTGNRYTPIPWQPNLMTAAW